VIANLDEVDCGSNRVSNGPNCGVVARNPRNGHFVDGVPEGDAKSEDLGIEREAIVFGKRKEKAGNVTAKSFETAL